MHTIPPCPSTQPDAQHAIYLIERRSDGRRYIGLTARNMQDRLRAHIYDAKREGRARTQGSLGTAIRETVQSGRTFEEDFRWAILQSGLTAEEACLAEARWIDRFDCSAPDGFNKLPAGSLGGPANAVRVTLTHPERGDITYSSLYTAIRIRNTELQAAGNEPLLPSTVYERVALGWMPEEALGYQPHDDGRGERDPVRYGDKRYRSLAAISRETGEPIATLRSRLHRARRAGVTDPNLAIDRRSAAMPRNIILLPDPDNPVTGSKLHVNEFSARTGVPRSTLVFRIGRMLEEGLDIESMDQTEVVRRLITEEDRRKPIRLAPADGHALSGGIREVIRMVLGDASLEMSRVEHIGDSAIRARLRLIDTHDADKVRWAFGFSCNS